MSEQDPKGPHDHDGPSEQQALRAIAGLVNRLPHLQCLELSQRGELLAGLGLTTAQISWVTDLLERPGPRLHADLPEEIFDPSVPCPIPWRPTVLTPVFWGRQLFEADDCLPVPLRVYYPSLEGSVQNAPILEPCGQYPLILFLHGHCSSEENHVHRWERMLAQLARSGFVVAAPFLSGIGAGPQQDTTFAHAIGALRWMRRHWPERRVLLPAPATGVAGHSYGAMVAARVATFERVGAFAGLSAGWHEWSTFGTELPIPLWDLAVPSFHAWGTEGLFSDALSDEDFARIARPRHRIVLEGGEHWEYLHGQTGGCAPSGGACHLLGPIAHDLLAGFFARYLPPSEAALAGAAIPPTLVPPEIDLTFQQEFYAGAHLSGLDMVPFSEGCLVSSSWATGDETGSVTLGNP